MGTTFRKPVVNASSSVNAAVYGKPDSRRMTPTKSAPDSRVSQPRQVGVLADRRRLLGLATRSVGRRAGVMKPQRCVRLSVASRNLRSHSVLGTVRCAAFSAAAVHNRSDVYARRFSEVTSRLACVVRFVPRYGLAARLPRLRERFPKKICPEIKRPSLIPRASETAARSSAVTPW